MKSLHPRDFQCYNNAGSKSEARAYSLPGAEMVLMMMMMMMMMMNLARSNVPSIELFF